MGSELELPQLEPIIARDGRGISVGALSEGSNPSSPMSRIRLLRWSYRDHTPKVQGENQKTLKMGVGDRIRKRKDIH